MEHLGHQRLDGALLSGIGQGRAGKVLLASEGHSNLLPILSVYGESHCLTSTILGYKKSSWEPRIVILGKMDPCEN